MPSTHHTGQRQLTSGAIAGIAEFERDLIRETHRRRRDQNVWAATKD